MRVLYDGYIFSAQEGGGISRYFASIIRRLPEEWQPIMWYGRQPQMIQPSHSKLKARLFRMDAIHPPGLSRKLARYYFKALGAFSAYDLVHPTYHFRLPSEPIIRNRRPLVLTVHDMIPELFAGDLDPGGEERRAKGQAIEAADAIICVSQNTKRDLQQLCHIPDERITVTYLASDLSKDMSFGPEPVPAGPYIVFIGNRGIYKNFARVLLAFARIAETWKELLLCVVGSSFNSSEIEFIRALRLEPRVRHLGFLSDRYLAKVYRCSEALIYPSLYEGFGIPPLEAMACGTVVIASDRASLPEVVGAAALLVDPENLEEIAQTMLSLRHLGSRRESLLAQGLAQAGRFSWDETAAQTAEVYRSVIA